MGHHECRCDGKAVLIDGLPSRCSQIRDPSFRLHASHLIFAQLLGRPRSPHSRDGSRSVGPVWKLAPFGIWPVSRSATQKMWYLQRLRGYRALDLARISPCEERSDTFNNAINSYETCKK